MKIDNDTNKLVSLSEKDAGQQVKNVAVKAVKVFCARTSSNFVSFMTDGKFTVAGTSLVDITEDMGYIISGKVTLWNGRPQIKLSSIKIAGNEDSENAITAAFLADNLEGAGKVISAALASEFGDKVIDVLAESPEQASSKIKNLTKEKAMSFCDQIAEKEEFFHEGLAAKHLGLSQEQIKTLYGMGELSSEKIKENPYSLLSKGIAGFALCDHIAMGEGCDIASEVRASAALAAAAQEVSFDTKSTKLTPLQVRKKALSLLNSGEGSRLSSDGFTKIFPNSCKMAIEDKNIVLFKFKDGKCIAADPEDEEALFAAPEYFKAEKSIKRDVERLLSARVKVPSKAESDRLMKDLAAAKGLVPDEYQLGALHLCMYSPLCVITGGPGTGKTTIMGILADYFRKNNITCAFAAPTGRAAKRLSESVGCEAATIHRMLGVRPVENEPGRMFFLHDHGNPIDARVVVVDEMSMVDTELFAMLLDAIGPATSLILVGDPDQLLSVGCGNVLKDLLSCRSIPSVRLEFTHRQNSDSSIAANAYRILNGEEPQGGGEDFEIIKTVTDEEAFDVARNLLKDLKGGDNCCLTPTKSETVMLGTARLNSMLQDLFTGLNGRKDELASIKRGTTSAFYVGDRVMQTRNNYNAEWLDPVTNETVQGVFNGEMGEITDIDPIENTMSVLFDDGKRVKYTTKMIEDIELAYAVTVHKSQGCEFENVVIVLGKMNALLYKRSLLYTAVTRGKSKVIIVDSGNTMSRFLKAVRSEERSTSLKDFLAIIDYKRGI